MRGLGRSAQSALRAPDRAATVRRSSATCASGSSIAERGSESRRVDSSASDQRPPPALSTRHTPAPGLALTERGERIREVLTDNWQQLEDALLGELPDKKRKGLDKALKRFVELLRL